jgi:hypothetical protein
MILPMQLPCAWLFAIMNLTNFLAQVTKFVDGLLSSRHDLASFKNHIRDFLVQSKEFSAQVTYPLLATPKWISLLVNMMSWCRLYSVQVSSHELLWLILCCRITRICMRKRLLCKEKRKGSGCLPFQGSLPQANCKTRWWIHSDCWF